LRGHFFDLSTSEKNVDEMQGRGSSDPRPCDLKTGDIDIKTGSESAFEAESFEQRKFHCVVRLEQLVLEFV
jgi:hypothetical protein